jgi:hypothetical protein
MYWHCICTFSDDIADQMDLAYRDGLNAAGVRIAEDHFHLAMFLFTSHRLFWTLSWNMEALFDCDRDVVPGVSTRRTVCRYLREHARLAAALPRVEHVALASVTKRLETRLSELWPEAATD